MNIIDEAILNELSTMLGEEAMHRMMTIFIDEAQQRLQVLAKVLSSYQHSGLLDMAEVDIQAHTLKSSTASFGAQGLSVVSENLEMSAKAQDSEQVITLLNEVVPVGEQTLGYFRQRLVADDY